MQVSREGIDEIKRRNDLVEVVAEHGIELTRRGRGYFGLCPFHEEKAPSFAVSRESGLFHCFGCGVGGDVIGFVVRKDGLSFRDALHALAERAGATHALLDGVRRPERAQYEPASEGSCGLTDNGETLRSPGQDGLAQGDSNSRSVLAEDLRRRLQARAAVRFAERSLGGRS